MQIRFRNTGSNTGQQLDGLQIFYENHFFLSFYIISLNHIYQDLKHYILTAVGYLPKCIYSQMIISQTDKIPTVSFPKQDLIPNGYFPKLYLSADLPVSTADMISSFFLSESPAYIHSQLMLWMQIQSMLDPYPLTIFV